MDANEFIDNLRRDKACGVIAPHQIILLVALHNIYNEKHNTILNVDEVNTEFQKVWSQNNEKFQSKSNLVGMPLKALYNQRLIDLDVRGQIKDFRRLSDLKENIYKIILCKELATFLEVEGSFGILVHRITC